MSKLIMWNLMSLDGFFEGRKSWELDWHHLVLDDAFERFAIEQLRSADRLIFGRVTYEGMAAHWPKAQGEIAELMNRLPKLVFSRTLQRPAWANTTVAGRDAVAEVQKLKHEGSGNSLVFGSGSLSRALIEHGLFDEYRLLLTPVILGSGNPLFDHGLPRRDMKLLEAIPLPSGGIILRYEPIPG